MIDWTTIKATAKPLVSDLTKCPAVRWADEPEGSSWMQDPNITLTLKSLAGLGIEEERRADATDSDGNPTDDDQIVSVVGQKKFTLSLRAESNSQDIADIRHAGALLETLKTRLGRTTTAERIFQIFAISDVSDVFRIGYVDADRQVSAYGMDIFCLTVDNDIDDSDGSGGYIDEVEIAGTVNDAGVLRPVDLDVKGD